MKTLSTAEISVLDLARIPANGSIAEAYSQTREAAQTAESSGYKRFWLAEHHSLEGIASAATSVLIGHVAERTKSIRVGSGGIMLPNHAPIVIAEQFGTLATLYPGRIDLGLGRAPGSDRETMRAIGRDIGTDFGLLIEDLLHYFAPAEPGQRVKAIPGAGIDVPIYVLGSSLYSAELAARMGLPYAFAGHFAPAEMMRAFAIYRAQFKPSRALARPYVMAGVPVIAADSNVEADYQATSIQQTFLGMVRGERGLRRPPVEDMNLVWNAREKAAVESMLGLLVTGDKDRVRQKLDVFVDTVGADELIVSSELFEHQDRLRSLRLIAEARAL